MDMSTFLWNFVTLGVGATLLVVSFYFILHQLEQKFGEVITLAVCAVCIVAGLTFLAWP